MISTLATTPIPEQLREYLSFDLFPLTSAICVALSCGLIGNHLVLRKQSMMGDAISHAVLPGLVAAFLLASSRSPMVMLLGAGASALVTVALIELVKRLGRVEPGAAMGVVFSVMFALGVLMLEQAAADHVDLDADCVLYGQLETLFFIAPDTWEQFFSSETLSAIPTQVTTLIGLTILVIIFKLALHKELRIASFDPGLATTQGVHSGLMSTLLMVMTAACAVASFEAVGSILVIAMLICPAAAARLCTDRLSTQIKLSAVFAVSAAIIGYLLASFVPEAIGMPSSLNAAGMMATVAGLLVAIAAIGSPSHGLIAKSLRQRTLRRTIAIEDLVGLLYRADETGDLTTETTVLDATLNTPDFNLILALAARQGLITRTLDSIELTDKGRQEGARIIRRHRLWEGYLVDQAGIRPDNVHDIAEQLEHLNTTLPISDTQTDPHDKPVPPR
ncbi:MAG: metal ABC transporter permease [Phycisphaerales bacterium]